MPRDDIPDARAIIRESLMTFNNLRSSLKIFQRYIAQMQDMALQQEKKRLDRLAYQGAIEPAVRSAYKAAGSPYGHDDEDMWRWWGEQEGYQP